MSNLNDALNRIYTWFMQKDPVYASSFYPPLSHQNIASRIESFIPITDEIFELYTWRNGSSKELRCIFAYDFNIMPIEEAVESAIFLRDENYPEYRYKGELLFPFASTQIGFHCVIIGMRESPVVFLSHEDSSDEIVYDSITAMMRSFAINLESGAYYTEVEGEDEGVIVEDENKVAITLRNENPNTLETIIEELVNLETLSKRDIDELMAYGRADGVFNAASRYRDTRFIDPLQRLLDKNDYYKNSLLQGEIIRTLGKIITL